jgi:CHAT domain-containing protein
MMLEGAAATPSRLLAAIRTAGYVEIHGHGIGDAADDAALIAMSSDADGNYALTATDIAKTRLAGHPIVVLAACGAGRSGKAMLGSHGLADAFVAAGARAVIASPEPIADASAPQIFGALRERITAGVAPARALAEVRAAITDPAQRAWVEHLVVFQ